jgi:hypothetical protein
MLIDISEFARLCFDRAGEGCAIGCMAEELARLRFGALFSCSDWGNGSAYTLAME